MFKLFSKPQNNLAQDDREERMKRLEEKRKQCIAEMGDKWVLHPSHAQQKLDKPRSF